MALFTFLLCLFFFSSADCGHFSQNVLDSELISSESPITLLCYLNRSVRSCGWLKNGNPLMMEPGRYETRGNPTEGDCSLYLAHPKVGDDTTFFNCNPSLDYVTQLISLPYRILTRKGSGSIMYLPYNITFEVTNDGSPIQRKVILSGVVGTTTRVRWFVDKELQVAETKMENAQRDLWNIRSSVQVKAKETPVMVHCCIEVKRDVFYKEVYVGVVYVIGDTYEISEFPSQPLIRTLPFQVNPPKLRMAWTYKGKKISINENRVILRVKDVKEAEFSVECADAGKSFSNYLSWGLIDPNGNAEVLNEDIEFKRNSSQPESISVKVKFLHPGHHISLQCQARSVFHAGVSKRFTVGITVREHDACYHSTSKGNHVQIQKFLFVVTVFQILINSFKF